MDARASGPEALRCVIWPGARGGSPNARYGHVLLIGLQLIAPAWSAHGPTLKEALEVPSDAEGQAVESLILIENLKGATRRPLPTPPAPKAAPAGTTSSAAPTTVPPPAEPPAQIRAREAPADKARSPSILEIILIDWDVDWDRA